MKLSRFTLLIFQLNAVVDAGLHEGVSLDEAKRHINAGDVLPWLRARYPEQFILTHSEGEDREIARRLNDLEGDFGGDDGQKCLVYNNGICLLVGWVTELIQVGGWELDRWTEPPLPRRRGLFSIIREGRRSRN